MKFFRPILTVLFLAAFSAVLASPSVTPAGRPEGQIFKWRAGPIKIAISTSLTKANPNIRSDSDVMGAIRRSLDAWSEAANIQFEITNTDRQSVSQVGVAGDGVSIITIASTPENVLFFARDAQNAAAKTRVFYNRKGAITEADIVLNPFQQFSTDGTYGTFDLQSALTHEIGHLLGLRHSDVLDSVMFANLAKNGANGPAELKPRQLADVDIAAVRDIYGTVDIMDDCCSSITGRLTLTNGKAARGLKVWAEDSASGRVVAQADTSTDGTFRMGGISAGTYRIFTGGGATSNEIATVELGPTDEKDLDQRVALEPSKLSVDLVGLDGELTESAIVVSRGSQHTVFLGGKQIDAKNISIATNSPFMHIDTSSILQRSAGPDSSVISFDLNVDRDIPRGSYSIFASSSASSKVSLVGAIRVD